MSRPAGARNHDFDEKRNALLNGLTDFAMQASLTRPSLRQFAIAAQQSEPTLRHYFGDRQGMVMEIVERIADRVAPIWDEVAIPSANPPSAIRDYLQFAEAGILEGGFIRAHAFGLIEGIADPVVGKVYLHKMLEPSLKAFSDKLAATPGAIQDETELRAATLAATAPIFFIGVHQYLLDGKDDIPFDISASFAHLQNWFARAFSPPCDS